MRVPLRKAAVTAAATILAAAVLALILESTVLARLAAGQLAVAFRWAIVAACLGAGLVAFAYSVIREVQERRREHFLAAHEAELLAAKCLLNAQSVSSGLRNALEQVCRFGGWSAAEIWIVPTDRVHPERTTEWHEEHAGLEAFMAQAIPPDVSEQGSGAAIETVRVIDVSHLAGNDRFQRAAQAAIHEAWRLAIPGARAEAILYGHPGDRTPEVLRTFLQAISPSLESALVRARAFEDLRRDLAIQRKRSDAIGLGICDLDGAGRIAWANAALARILECEPTALLGRSLGDFLSDPTDAGMLSASLRDEKPIPAFVCRVLTAVGRMKDVRIGVSVGEENLDGPRAVCTMEDVSSERAAEDQLRSENSSLRKRIEGLTDALKESDQHLLREAELRAQAEADLRRQQGRLDALIGQAPGILAVVSGGGVFEYVSPPAEAELGRPPDQLAGTSLFDLVHPDDLVAITAALKQMIDAPGVASNFEVRLVDSGGQYHEFAAVGESHLEDPNLHGVVLNLWSISERKGTEAALRESEERFRLLVEGIQDYAMFLLDRDGRVVSWNEGAARIKGYSEEEILGKHLSVFYLPEDVRQGLPLRNLETARRDGRLQAQGWRLRKDGSRFWAEVSITPLYDGEHRLQGFVKVTRDITALREANEQIRRKERQLSAAQLITHTGSWELNLATRRMSWSEELYRIFGVAPSDIDPTVEDYLDRIEPEDRDLLRPILEHAGDLGQPFEFEHRIVRPDGELRTLFSRGFVEKDELGVPVRMLGVDQDITERKRLEDVARAQQALYSSLLSAQSDLGEGVLQTDGDRVVYTNPALDAFFALDSVSRESLAALLDRVDPARLSPLRSELERRSVEVLPPAKGQLRFTRSDGSALELEYTIKTTSLDGHARSFVLVRDVTERNRAEAELRTSREQLRAFSSELSRVREEESARISREIHDELGQRLTGLKMDTAWLASKLRTAESSSGVQLTDKTRTMSDLIDDTIRQVRRIATELRPGLLDDLGLTAALEWQADEFQGRTGIHCSVHAPPDTAGITAEQSTALFRILQEALTNVARHAQAKNVNITLAVEDGQIRLDVFDDGRGITAQEAGRSSLGLVGMAERARLLGGETTVEPGQGKGTIVRVRLPLSTGSPAGEGA